MTDELKKCPICGAASELNSLVCPDNKLMYWPNCSNADCCLSDKWEVKSGNREEAVAAWNLRAPETGTSVIRWTRYDGTPETLPENGIAFLYIHNGIWMRQSYSFHPTKKKPLLIIGDILGTPFRSFTDGDLWAYLHGIPEGMK